MQQTQDRKPFQCRLFQPPIETPTFATMPLEVGTNCSYPTGRWTSPSLRTPGGLAGVMVQLCCSRWQTSFIREGLVISSQPIRRKIRKQAHIYEADDCTNPVDGAGGGCHGNCWAYLGDSGVHA